MATSTQPPWPIREREIGMGESEMGREKGSNRERSEKVRKSENEGEGGQRENITDTLDHSKQDVH